MPLELKSKNLRTIIDEEDEVIFKLFPALSVIEDVLIDAINTNGVVDVLSDYFTIQET